MRLWLADALRRLAARLDPCDAHVIELLGRRGLFPWPARAVLRPLRQVRPMPCSEAERARAERSVME
jgi:hypothetical protein